MLKAKNEHIIPNDGGWVVRHEALKKTFRFFENQKHDVQSLLKSRGLKRHSCHQEPLVLECHQECETFLRFGCSRNVKFLDMIQTLVFGSFYILLLIILFSYNYFDWFYFKI